MGTSRNSRSTGEMISTFAFAGMAAKLTYNALEWDGGLLAHTALWLSAIACLLGALRFPLQAIKDRSRR